MLQKEAEKSILTGHSRCKCPQSPRHAQHPSNLTQQFDNNRWPKPRALGRVGVYPSQTDSIHGDEGQLSPRLTGGTGRITAAMAAAGARAVAPLVIRELNKHATVRSFFRLFVNLDLSRPKPIYANLRAWEWVGHRERKRGGRQKKRCIYCSKIQMGPIVAFAVYGLAPTMKCETCDVHSAFEFTHVEVRSVVFAAAR